ncbi:MAG: phosphoglucosamine mutase [Halobacteria archaeon]
MGFGAAPNRKPGFTIRTNPYKPIWIGDTNQERMFGTSGIRGVVGEDITPKLALKVGAAIGEPSEKVTVGRDTRLTGSGLENAAVSGITSRGADVELLGIAPTPTVARYADGNSLVVTASHNPMEYNGFKLWNPDGTAFDEEQRKETVSKIREGVATEPPERFGDVTKQEDAIDKHVEEVVGSISVEGSLKVVVDGGSGAGSRVTPKVLREIGCEVVTINCNPDGTFPGRLPEPTEENLGDLKEAVVAADADLGVAHDGDADRTAVVDSTGSYVQPDRLMAVFAESVDADEVVAPLNTSMVVDHVADVTHTKVGDVYVAEKLRETEAPFGGEPSNSWIFPRQTFCPDGVYAAAKAAEIASRNPFSERLQELPEYVIERGSLECDEERKAEVMDQVREDVCTEFDEYSTVDGVRADTEDGWFLVRPSGTEPLIRVTAQADSGKLADELYSYAEDVLRRHL